MSQLSQSPALGIIAKVLAVVPIGIGINAFLRPAHALSLFEFEPPASAADRQMVDGLMVVYGVRDAFMGLALYSAASFGSRKALGWIFLGASAVAGVDGYVCWSLGKGYWNHWGFAPVLATLGVTFLGCFDRA